MPTTHLQVLLWPFSSLIFRIYLLCLYFLLRLTSKSNASLKILTSVLNAVLALKELWQREGSCSFSLEISCGMKGFWRFPNWLWWGLFAETQGLAPHYDDVDLWVCQTLGSKHWKIYKSPEGYQLPAISSTDFQQTQLGKPILETTLEVKFDTRMLKLSA